MFGSPAGASTETNSGENKTPESSPADRRLKVGPHQSFLNFLTAASVFLLELQK